MRAEELPGWLGALGVSDVAVGVGVEAEGAWCVRAVPDADHAHDRDAEEEPEWEVFWSEQGGRYEWVRFADEATACFALFGRLVWARAVRRGG